MNRNVEGVSYPPVLVQEKGGWGGWSSFADLGTGNVLQQVQGEKALAQHL